MDMPQWKEINESYIEEARVRLRQTPCTFVLGAGVSASAGLPQWNDLLMGLAHLNKDEFLALEKAMGNSEIRVAGYIIKSKYGAENPERNTNGELVIPKVRDDIRDILYKDPNAGAGSRLIPALCNIISNKSTKIESIITYNFDDLVELGLDEKNKGLEGVKESKYKSVKYISVYKGNRADEEYKLPIYHVHGFIPRSGSSSEIVISESDYHKLYTSFLYWSNIEQLHAFYRNTCFFVGLSMNDPNLRRLLENAYKEGGNATNHYAILERRSVFEDEGQNEEALSTQESILHDLGIKIIWYENENGKHEKVPEILNKLNKEPIAGDYEEL